MRLTLFYGLFVIITASSITFAISDVSSSERTYSYIQKAVQKNVLVLSSDGKFSPAKYLTREELAKAICQMKNIDASSCIEDIQAAEYMSPLNDGKFHSNKIVSRVEALDALVRAEELLISQKTETGYSDIPKHDRFANTIVTAVEARIIPSGHGRDLGRDRKISRSAFAVLLNRSQLFASVPDSGWSESPPIMEKLLISNTGLSTASDVDNYQSDETNLSDIDDSLEGLRYELQRSKKERRALYTRKQELLSEVSKLKHALSKLQSSDATTKTQLHQQEQENFRVAKKLESLTQNLDVDKKLETKLSLANKENAKLIKKTQSQEAALQKERISTSQKINDLQYKIAQQRQVISDNADIVAQQKLIIKQEGKEKSQLYKRKQELLSELKANPLQSKLKISQTNIVKLESVISANSSVIQSLKKQLAKSTKDKEAIYKRKLELAKSVATFDKAKQSLINTHKNQTAKQASANILVIKKLENRVKIVQQEKAVLFQRKQELIKSVSDLVSTNKKLSLDLNKLTKTTASTGKTNKTVIAKLEKQIQKLTKEKAEIYQRKVDITKEVKNLRTTNSKLAAENQTVQTLQNKISKLEASVKTQTQHVDLLSKSLVEKGKSLSLNAQSIAQLQGKLKKAEVGGQALFKRKQEIVAQHKTLSAKLSKEQSSLKALQVKHNKLTTKLEKIEAKHKNITTKHVSLTQKYEKLFHGHDTVHNLEADLKKKVITAGELESKNQELSYKVEQLQSEKKELTVHTKKLEEKNKKLVETTKQQTAKQIASIRTKIKELIAENTSFKKELEKKDQKVKASLTQGDKISSLELSLAQTKKELDDILKTKAALNIQLMEAKNQLAQRAPVVNLKAASSIVTPSFAMAKVTTPGFLQKEETLAKEVSINTESLEVVFYPQPVLQEETMKVTLKKIPPGVRLSSVRARLLGKDVEFKPQDDGTYAGNIIVPGDSKGGNESAVIRITGLGNATGHTITRNFEIMQWWQD